MCCGCHAVASSFEEIPLRHAVPNRHSVHSPPLPPVSRDPNHTLAAACVIFVIGYYDLSVAVAALGHLRDGRENRDRCRGFSKTRWVCVPSRVVRLMSVFLTPSAAGPFSTSQSESKPWREDATAVANQCQGQSERDNWRPSKAGVEQQHPRPQRLQAVA